jgi:WD40 repeat protein
MGYKTALFQGKADSIARVTSHGEPPTCFDRGARPVTAVLICALLGLLVAAPAAQGAFPGANGRISFSSDQDGNGNLFSMPAAAGGAWLRLTTDPADDAQSAWSPDGRRIAFRSRRDGNYEVYVMNADGSAQTRLTLGPPSFSTQPSWSPDARRLLFRSNRDGDPEVWIMDADGTDPQQITNHPGDERYPGFSPDGGRIVFISDRDGDYEIYVMDPDGTNVRQLTSNVVLDSAPAWSPDGSRIAFRSERDGQSEIYVMDADGANQQRLTENATHDEGPAWSPDGKWIVFRSDRDGNGELYLMDRDGGNQTRLTNSPSREQSPDWQAVVPATGPGSAGASPPLAGPQEIRPPTPVHGVQGEGAADRIAPVISDLALSRKRFRARRGSGAAARAGTTIRYRLSEAATVAYIVSRRLEVRRVSGRCRALSPKKSKRRRCLRYRRVGRFVQRGVAGKNKKRFSGRIGRSWLRAASYRVTLVATDVAGNRSLPKRISFKVVGPRKPR